MTFDKAAYQLDYMRRRRAGEATSWKQRALIAEARLAELEKANTSK